MSRKKFAKVVSPEDARVLSDLTTPDRVQAFLDTLAYNPEERWFRCPASVLRDRVAHCFEGAVFAAAVLRDLGYDPLIVNMFPEPGTDDEHLVAVFRKHGAWGAVGLSNFVGLRYREPIHRTIRELVLSYFEQYYNVARQKTLRTFTRPLDLSAFDRKNWLASDETMFVLDRKLDAMKRFPLLSKAMIAGLLPVDPRSYEAGLSGANPAGLYPAGKIKQ